jgi:hypothetical protein
VEGSITRMAIRFVDIAVGWHLAVWRQPALPSLRLERLAASLGTAQARG